MGKLVAVVVLVTLGATPVAGAQRGREGCQAMNPFAPKCSFEVTHTSRTPVTGVAGVGKWVVVVRRGAKKIAYEGLPDGRFTAYEIAFKVGDKVTARALAPGSGVTVGHED